ncbi:MAG: translocation and assembly module TamB [Candidatus Tokpelaia sp. JSC085]|nr:MAG: translocation and assembly module TamB [Candidatus Tokpelaia sp. JSC085]
MTRLFRFLPVILALALLCWAVMVRFPVNMRESDALDNRKTWFLSFIEKKISGRGQEIQISDLDGLFTSRASIGLITVADKNGIWLKIYNAKLDWNRIGLLVGRVSINSLSAARIEVLRRPLLEATPETGGHGLPFFSPKIMIDTLEAKKILCDKQLFGTAFVFSLDGYLTVSGGAFASGLYIKRLDSPGGIFRLIASGYGCNREYLILNFVLSKPANGLTTNFLQTENQSSVNLANLALQGRGSFNKLDIQKRRGITEYYPVLEGSFRWRAGQDGRIFHLSINGPFASVIPEFYQPFFGKRTRFNVDGILKSDGGLRLNNVFLEGTHIFLAGQIDMTPDGFLRQLLVDARINLDRSTVLPLRIRGGQASVRTVVFNLAYGITDSWKGELVVHDLTVKNFHSDNLTICIGGIAENLDDPATRHVSLIIRGIANVLTFPRLDTAKVLDRQHVRVNANMDWCSDSPLVINTLEINAGHIILSGHGIIKNFVFQGRIGLKIDDLAQVSEFVSYPLAGILDLTAIGKIDLAACTFDIELEGIERSGLLTRAGLAGRLFRGHVNFSGGIRRDISGMHAHALKISSKEVQITIDGHIADEFTDINVGLFLPNMAFIDPRIQGPFVLKGTARGKRGFIEIGLSGSVTDGIWWGRKLSDIVISFNGVLNRASLETRHISGMVNSSGFFGEEKLMLSTAFRLDGDKTILENINVVIGQAELSGNVARGRDGLIHGNLHLDAADISTLSALFFMAGKGAAYADIILDAKSDRQNAMINAAVHQLDISGIHIATFKMQAVLCDLFGVPKADGMLNGSAIQIAGYELMRIRVLSKIQERGLYFTAEAGLKNKNTIMIAGTFSSLEDGGWRLLLDHAGLYTHDANLALLHSSKISFQKDGGLTMSDLTVHVGNGSFTIRGKIADTINLFVDMKNIPLSVANLIWPDIKMAGIVKGTAVVTGDRTNPSIDFDISVSGMTADILRKKGVPAFNCKAYGKTTRQILSLNAQFFGSGLTINTQGRVFIAQRKIDFDIMLKDAPFSALNSIVKYPDLKGSVTAAAHISGIFTNPVIKFSIEGKDLTSKWLTDHSQSPVHLSAKGFYNDDILHFERLYLKGDRTLNIKLSGRLPLSGSGLDFRIDGSLPLSLAHHFLSERGSQLSGLLIVNTTVSGSLKEPSLDGTVVVANGQLIDPDLNVRLNAITIAGKFHGDRLVLETASAVSVSGGSLSIAGQISTNFMQGFPASLTLNLNHTRYNDGKTLIAIAHGKMTMIGALMRDPVISGNLLIEKADINIPGHSGHAVPINVQHRHLTVPIVKTLKRAHAESSQINTSTTVSHIRGPKFDLHLDAPSQIFVHGHGLNVELHGHLHLVGPVMDLHPIGRLNMVRGRIEILAQHLNFREGQVTMTGNLNPELDFIAVANSDDITITVKVSGMPQNLNMTFTSQPALPQDEILSRLIFKRPIRELSPFQVVQLVDTTAELAGIQDKSILSSLRSGIGLDKLDFVTDALGNTGFEAGRYINKNFYLGIETVTGGVSRGTVNIDINRHLKGKVAVGSDSNSNAGLFYEKDY